MQCVAHSTVLPDPDHDRTVGGDAKQLDGRGTRLVVLAAAKDGGFRAQGFPAERAVSHHLCCRHCSVLGVV